MQYSTLLPYFLLFGSLSTGITHTHAQCEPGPIGNDVSASGTHSISWRSQLIVNKYDLYTNINSEPVLLQVENFNFHAYKKGNPITPFIALVLEENNFTVLEIGTTRTPNDYNIGDNSIPFNDELAPLTVAPGATIATGYMEAYPDGSGIVTTGNITLNVSGGSVWFSGSPSKNRSASIVRGQKIIEGHHTYPSLNWDNKFNIELCELPDPYHSELGPNSDYYVVNTRDDGEDISIGDGICANANGKCSLRAAIQEANAGSNGSSILFHVNGDLTLNQTLPSISTAGYILIDGFSAPGYEKNKPTVRPAANSFGALQLNGIDGVEIRGLDLSSDKEYDFDSFGIDVQHCSRVNIHQNVIRNRGQAIHVANVTDISIEENDLRDSGSSSADPALFLENVKSARIPSGMRIANNQLGGLKTQPHVFLKLYQCKDVLISDGTVPESNIIVDGLEDYHFPILIYASKQVQVQDLDLSFSGGSMKGIGVLSWNSIGVKVMNNKIRNRIMAVNIDGGNNIQILENDLRDSGLNPSEASIAIEHYQPKGLRSLVIKNNRFGMKKFMVMSYLSISKSSDISIGAPDTGKDIELTGIMDAMYAIKIHDSHRISIEQLNFIRSNADPQSSKAIWLDGASSDIRISENYFDGWACGLHAEDATEISFDCNTSILNKNGILADNTSSFSSLSQNNFGCNAVAIQHRGSALISTSENYWGDPSGSSSQSGIGDYVIGPIDVSSHSVQQNACAVTIPALLCNGEVCDNGIDDDLDGLIDCADEGCSTSPYCNSSEIASNEDRSSNKNVDFVVDDTVFKVYPNPNSGIFIMELYHPCWEYRIYDMSGKKILQGDLVEVQETAIDMSEFMNGMYMIELVTNEQVLMRSIVKH